MFVIVKILRAQFTFNYKLIMNIENIFKDKRLAPVLSENNACYLSLWLISSIKHGSKMYRHIYGRVIPYSFSDDKWRVEENVKVLNQDSQPIRVVNLHIKLNTTKIKAVLEYLYKGYDLEKISTILELTFDKKCKLFSTFKLDKMLGIKPTAWLPSRMCLSVNETIGLKSPLPNSSAYSASIYSLDKDTIFDNEEILDKQLVLDASNCIEKNTKLNLLGLDSDRLGNLEIFHSPELNVNSVKKLQLFYKNEKVSFKYIPERYENWAALNVTVKLFLDNIEIEKHQIQTPFKQNEACSHTFFLSQYYDGIQVNISGQLKQESSLVTTIFSQRQNFINSINVGMNIIELSGKLKLDWLDKGSQQKKDLARLNNTKSFSKYQSSDIHVKGPNIPKWELADNNFKIKISSLFMKKSEGDFFEKLADNGRSRIEVVEWFQKLFKKYSSHDFHVFDPFWETNGTTLFAKDLNKGSNLFIYTDSGGEDKKQEKIENFKKCYESMAPLFLGSRFKVSFVSRKGGNPAIHDRYFLITEKDSSTLVKGFHLSNSIQKANENHPLLITLIEESTLEKVTLYLSGLLSKKSALETAFDSKSEVINPHTPSSIVEFNSILEVKMFLNLCSHDSLEEDIELLGNRLANSNGSIISNDSFALSDENIELLLQYLSIRKMGCIADSNITDILSMNSFINKDFKSWIQSSYQFEHLIRSSCFKSSVMNWGDFFAVQLILKSSPERFTSLLQEWAKEIQLQTDEQYTLTSVLFAYGLRELSLSLMLGTPSYSLSNLLCCNIGILKWFGYHLLGCLIQKNKGNVIDFIEQISDKDKLHFIAWILTNENPCGDLKPWFLELSDYLNDDILKLKVSSEQCEILLGSSNTNLGQLNPWIYDKVIQPLLESERLHIDDITQLFIIEQMKLWNNSNVNYTMGDSEFSISMKLAGFLSQASCQLKSQFLNDITEKARGAERFIRKPLACELYHEKWSESVELYTWLYGALSQIIIKLDITSPKYNEFVELQKNLFELFNYVSASHWETVTSGKFFKVNIEQN